MALAVVAAFAVGVVVFVVVGDQVADRKPVVGRHEVDRSVGAATGVLVEV